jgi:serine/threonine protein kinase
MSGPCAHGPERPRTGCPACRAALAVTTRLADGTQVAGFVIEALGYAGPVATVYRARRGDERVALKLYPPGLLQSEVSRRVEREGRAQGLVAHPCVGRLLDWGFLDDGSAFLASEWVSGQPLEEKLAAGALDWDALAPVIVSVAAGLAAIHQVGIVHRDLKPSNILLPGSGQPAAVIIDFGHSLVLDAVRLTEVGITVGSAAYMAPEQAAGAGVDARADLYALGAILYRGLTGELPHRAASAAEVLRMHQVEPVVPPRLRAPARDIPAAAEDLAMWLLAKDPAQRAPSARVLLNTLRYVGARSTERVA